MACIFSPLVPLEVDERLWCLGFATVEGKGGGEDVSLVERGTFGMPLAVLVEEEKQFGFASEEFTAPFPRRDVANRANDVVVGFHKRGEDKTAILIFLLSTGSNARL